LKKPSIPLFSILLLLVVFITSSASAQLWQWSIPVKGGINKFGPSTAFLWIPPNCSKLRAVVLAQNNMEELSVIENKAFRDSMASVNVGIIWVSPAFDGLFNVPAGAGKTFTKMMIDLADESGYKELQYVPVVPMGHSATANFSNSFAAWFPERTLCGVSISGILPYDFTNIFAPDTWEGRNVDYVPLLTTMGEYEGAGDSSANFDRIFSRREAHQLTPISLLPCAGEYHFATSQKKTNFIAYYIKRAIHYRLVKDATAISLAVLKPINPTTSGWLVDRWRKNVKPRFPRNKVALYTGIKKESFWCFDEDMARRVEDYENKYYGKIPCLLAYNQNGKQVPQTNNHVQVSLKFLPLNDSLDFQLSSSFLDTVPAISGRCRGWAQMPVGSKIGHPSNPQLSSIDRTIGPFVKLRYEASTGITTFRMQLEPGLAPVPTNYKATTIFSLSHPGDAIYKPSVLQADIGIAVKNSKGLPQTIDFPELPNVKSGTPPITLNAVSDKGLPVQYLIQQGPVILQGNQLRLTKIPPQSRYPVKVTIIAWQWGRNDDLAEATKGTNAPFAGQTVQTAQPVERTFYITKEK
jgi:hypothetical protein